MTINSTPRPVIQLATAGTTNFTTCTPDSTNSQGCQIIIWVNWAKLSAKKGQTYLI